MIITRWWSMVRRAAGFIACNGPVTLQDRWEEDSGYSPFTLAVEIAGLLAAADLAEAVKRVRDGRISSRNSQTAWNDNARALDLLDEWRVWQSKWRRWLLRRIAPADTTGRPHHGRICPHQEPSAGTRPRTGSHVISPDALALVRFGLRAPDDPNLNTVKVIDALLRVKLPQGPCWYRYNDDGYGEHDDGGPFDGKGVGRPGRCSQESAHTTSLMPAARTPPKNCSEY